MTYLGPQPDFGRGLCQFREGGQKQTFPSVNFLVRYPLLDHSVSSAQQRRRKGNAYRSQPTPCLCLAFDHELTSSLLRWANPSSPELIAMQHVGQTRAGMGSGFRFGLYNRYALDLTRNALAPFAFR